MDHRFQRYLKIFSSFIAVSLLFVGILNSVVDPFCAYQTTPNNPLLPYKHRLGSRTAKAEMLRAIQPNTIILGNSRSLAFDPTSEHWNDRTYNLGLPGASFYEMHQAFEYSFQHAPIKRVFVCLDIEQFSGGSVGIDDFELSRFNQGRSWIEYHLDNLFSIRSTTNSINTLAYCVVDNRSHFTVLGDVPFKAKAANFSTRGLFVSTITEAVRETSLLKLHKPNLHLFRKMIQTCQKKQIELIVVILPVHAMQLEAMAQSQSWHRWENWKRMLVKVIHEEASGKESGDMKTKEKDPPTSNIALWDFTNYEFASAEPMPEDDTPNAMEWWVESLHFKQALANEILEEIFQGTSSQISGVKLTPHNLHRELEIQREARLVWLDQDPKSAKWIHSLTNRLAPQQTQTKVQIANSKTSNNRF